MKKLLTLTMVTLMLVAFGVATAEAQTADVSVTVTVTAGALSVSVDPTSWAAGPLAEGASTTTGTGGTFTATNDSTNVT